MSYSAPDTSSESLPLEGSRALDGARTSDGARPSEGSHPLADCHAFDTLVGQEAAIERLVSVAQASRTEPIAHAWLFTGPPGSGRSTAALAFAAALQCTSDTPGCGTCSACRSVLHHNHPDVVHITTEAVTITVDEVRHYVSESFRTPSSGRYTIMIIEDADRMAERTTNVLLKAIEEPPPTTLWILCTTAPLDVLPTIRSRCQHLNLVTPRADAVAELLVREGYDPQAAAIAAHAAQSHIGRARGLLRDPHANDARRELVARVLGIRSAGDAVALADAVVNETLGTAAGGGANTSGSASAAKSSPKSSSKSTSKAAAKKEALEELYEQEKAALLEKLGIDAANADEPSVKAQLKDLRESLTRREKRAQRDRLDRALIDISSVLRDVLVVKLGADVEMMNVDFLDAIRERAAITSLPAILRQLDAVSTARTRLAMNGNELLVMEAFLAALRH